MSFSKDLKKIFVCGTSLLLITSLGTGITNVSAHRIHRYHYRYSRQIRNSQRKYSSVVRYLRWVRRYDLTHKRPHTSWELRHINRYVTGFNYGQKRYVYKMIKGLSSHYVKRNYKRVSKQHKQVNSKRSRVKTYRHHKSHKSTQSTVANVADLEKPNGKNIRSANTDKHASQTNNSQPAAINTNVPVVAPASSVTNNTSNNQPKYNPQPAPVIDHHVTPTINNDNNVNENLDELKNQSLIDFNNDRQINGLPALKVDPRLETYAGLRAQQITTDYEHKFANSTAEQADMSVNQPIWENIDKADLGTDYQYGDPNAYHNHNGNDMANETNDVFMNYDQPEENGHRNNILNPYETTIGIGAAQSNGKYYLAEDMSNY